MIWVCLFSQDKWRNLRPKDKAPGDGKRRRPSGPPPPDSDLSAPVNAPVRSLPSPLPQRSCGSPPLKKRTPSPLDLRPAASLAARSRIPSYKLISCTVSKGCRLHIASGFLRPDLRIVQRPGSAIATKQASLGDNRIIIRCCGHPCCLRKPRARWHAPPTLHPYAAGQGAAEAAAPPGPGGRLGAVPQRCCGRRLSALGGDRQRVARSVTRHDGRISSSGADRLPNSIKQHPCASSPCASHHTSTPSHSTQECTLHHHVHLITSASASRQPT